MRRGAAPAGSRRTSPAAPRGRPLAAVAGWRTAAYRVFAALLLRPDLPRLRWLGEAAGELRAYDDELSAFGFFGPWLRLLSTLETLAENELPALQQEHVRLFSVNPCGTPCFPFESHYVAQAGQEAGWLAVQLLQTYHRSGLDLSPSLNAEPDHAAVELEFMAYLCDQEAAAWERAATDAAVDTLAQQRLFLRLHLGRWFGLFAGQVQASATEPLYARAAEAADAFIHHDRDLVDGLLSAIESSRLGESVSVASVDEDPTKETA